MNYLFYLEPYTFILNGDDKSVVYNTLSAAYIPVPKHPVVERIKATWENAANGYGCEISEEERTDAVVAAFIHEVRESFSGDCIEWEAGRTKPFIFKPQLFVNKEILLKQEKDETLWGNRILQNLSEVTLYVSATCAKHCPDCMTYSRQLPHCATYGQDLLTVADYIDLLKRLEVYGVKRVNLIAGGDPLANSSMRQILAAHAPKNYRLHLYMDFDALLKREEPLPAASNVVWEILAHGEDLPKAAAAQHSYRAEDVYWNLIVTSEQDMDAVGGADGAHTKVVPYYTGKNLPFFEDYVFMDLDDLLAEPVDRRSIFRHQSLNENFFGKVTIVPTGEVYAHLQSEPLGNIKEATLKELIYKEFTERDVWLHTRSKAVPCKGCVNRDLCPSVSLYELAIGRNNLCHIR